LIPSSDSKATSGPTPAAPAAAAALAVPMSPLEATIEIQYKDSTNKWITAYPLNGMIFLPKGIQYTIVLRKFTCDYAMKFIITLDGVRTFGFLLAREVLSARFFGDSKESSFVFDQVTDDDINPNDVNNRVGRISVYYSFCTIKDEVKVDEKKSSSLPPKIGKATTLNSGGSSTNSGSVSLSSSSSSSSSSTGLTGAMNAVNINSSSQLGMTKNGGPSGQEFRRFVAEDIQPHHVKHWAAWLRLRKQKTNK